MQANKYDVSRLRYRVQFGDMKKTGRTPNGVAITTFVKSFEVAAGDYTQSLNQQITLAGLYKTSTRVIVIRHNEEVLNHQVAQIDGKVYRIEDINSDDTVNAYDLVTLVETEGYK